MIHLNIRTVPPYKVKIGEDLLPRCGELIREELGSSRAAVITDSKVDLLYSDAVMESLQNSGFSPVKYVFPQGESSKNGETLLSVLNFLAEQHLTRSDLVVALGGGVVGDLAGFAASCYLRGVRFVQLPTTLLAAADSSVGGKTAIDLPAGKNLAGSFHQPSLVICDIGAFRTLAPETLADGKAEVIKSAMIKSEKLFRQLTEDGFTDKLLNTVARCVAIKADLVEQDEHDTGARMLLNFGHTVGHAIEARSGFSVPHGHAIAMGMVCVTKAALQNGLCGEDCLTALTNILTENGLPTALPYSMEELLPLILSDKKRTDDKITLIVPREIGACEPMKLPVSRLKTFFII